VSTRTTAREEPTSTSSIVASSNARSSLTFHCGRLYISSMGRCRCITGILLRVILAFSVGLLLLALFCSTTVHANPERRTLSIHTVNGAEIFRDYCAPCHGLDGRGNGPVASALKFEVPDLIQVSKRAVGKFPRARIRDVIEGNETLSGHGSRDMPIWGPIFHQIDVDQDLGGVRTDNVTGYIESLQRK
jgi:mono/diheme cytochrome c family protein